MSEQTPEWLEQLPEPMRELPFIGKSQSMEEAINHIKDAADTMGNSLRIPGPNAGDEDKKRFQERVLEKFPDLMPVPSDSDDEAYAKVLERLGAPGEHTAYKLPEIEGFKWDEGFAESLQKQAQAAGLTKRQFTEYAKQVGTQMHEQGLSAQQAHEQAIGQLKQEWGEAFDSRRQQMVNYLEQTQAPESLRAAVKDGKADPATMKWLHQMMAKSRKEDPEGADQGGPAGGDPVLTPTEAQARIQEILNNPDYFNPGPRQKVLMEEMLKMQRLANPQS